MSIKSPPYLILTECLIIFQQIKNWRRVFVKHTKEFWEKTCCSYKEENRVRWRVLSHRRTESDPAGPPASPGSSSFSSAELRLAMSCVKKLVFSIAEMGDMFVQSLSSKFWEHRKPFSLSLKSKFKTQKWDYFYLTTLPSVFLGVCVYRGVRPAGAKMAETSATLGVTEKQGEMELC